MAKSAGIREFISYWRIQKIFLNINTRFSIQIVYGGNRDRDIEGVFLIFLNPKNGCGRHKAGFFYLPDTDIELCSAPYYILQTNIA